jgi:hypothetical protein
LDYYAKRIKHNNMKNILLLFLLLPTLLLAQRELERDSVWLSRQAIYTTTGTTTTTTYNYFQHTLYVYTNGESDTQVRLLGDSATATNYVAGQQIDNIRQLSYHAGFVYDKPQVVKEWQQMHIQTDSVGLGGMAGIIQGLFEGAIIGDVTVKVGTANAVPGDIVKAANGNVRLLFGSKGYRIFVFSDTMLRVMGYPATGQSIDLYRVRTGVFADIDRALIIWLKK